MKVVYIIIAMILVSLFVVGGSLYSTTSAIKSTVVSAANEIQRGGRKSSILFAVFFGLFIGVLSWFTIIFILSKLRN